MHIDNKVIALVCVAIFFVIRWYICRLRRNFSGEPTLTSAVIKPDLMQMPEYRDLVRNISSLIDAERNYYFGRRDEDTRMIHCGEENIRTYQRWAAGNVYDHSLQPFLKQAMKDALLDNGRPSPTWLDVENEYLTEIAFQQLVKVQRELTRMQDLFWNAWKDNSDQALIQARRERISQLKKAMSDTRQSGILSKEEYSAALKKAEQPPEEYHSTWGSFSSLCYY
jgi:hypothetical protein